MFFIFVSQLCLIDFCCWRFSGLCIGLWFVSVCVSNVSLVYVSDFFSDFFFSDVSLVCLSDFCLCSGFSFLHNNRTYHYLLFLLSTDSKLSSIKIFYFPRVPVILCVSVCVCSWVHAYCHTSCYLCFLRFIIWF